MQFLFENVVSSRSKNKVAHKIIIKAGGFETPRLNEPINNQSRSLSSPQLVFSACVKESASKALSVSAA